MSDQTALTLGPGSKTRFILGGLAALLATTALTNVALAAPDNCTETGTGTFVCTGNQSQGAANGNSKITSSATSITVNDLTALPKNAPYGGPFKITSDQSAKDVPTVDLSVELGDIEQVVSHNETRNVSATTTAGTSSADAPDIDVMVQGTLTNEAAREVVELTSTGANGKNGQSGSTGYDGTPGGNGGDGGDIALVIGPRGGTSMLSAPDGDTAVILSSYGGSGGAGGTGGKGGGDVNGGSGGFGGAGGALTILTNGPTTISSVARSVTMRSNGTEGGSGGGGSGSGGQGGAGGDGGTLYFDRDGSGTSSTGSWTITNTGDGIAALSLISNGGDGNFSGGTDLLDGQPGGDGGDGGAILFGDAGRLITVQGTGSTAVSISGAGGIGNNGSGNEGNDQIGKPGPGGNGGDGSRVALEGSWDITATGDGSVGINVTSTGGTGGRAGFSSFTPRSGGLGGNGGTISSIISANSTIHSDGTAIAFSSTGGKGGRGNNVNRDPSGGGNTGGAGGKILLGMDPSGATSTGSWIITTESASAIVLESTGGDGGYGGSDNDGSTEKNDGGPAGTGGVGGDIEIASGSRKITTSADDAHGLYALSVGGLGGYGGAGSKAGGNGGDGGDGGNISLDVHNQQSGNRGWNVRTTGPGAIGILAITRAGDGRSGGTGGSQDGGIAGRGGVGGDITLAQGTRKIATTGEGSHAISLGSFGGDGGNPNTSSDDDRIGAGGSGDDAGNVSVSGATTVITRGSSAFGLKIQSLGGDGKGLYGESGSAPQPSNGGNGGNVTIENGSSLEATTFAPDAFGVSILSQGGLGGFGEQGGEGLSGAGGDISVFGELTIQTGGENANGLSMISVGGAGKPFQSQGQDAGSVTMVADASVETAADGARGIVARSQGGNASGGNDAVAAGDGKSVNVSLIGGAGVITSGEAAHGLVAQSLGGTNPDSSFVGTASTVNVNTVASIIASGPGALGIYAQSVGKSAGDITVTVGADAFVVGGLKSPDASLPDGAGIRVVGGTENNVINNYGTIGYTTGSTQTGNAIVIVGEPKTKVHSSGIINGNVIREGSTDESIADGQSGGITLINERSGILASGSRLDADVTNRGVLSPGGDSAQRTTAVSGDLKQTSTGTLAIEVSGKGTHDQVDVAGTASLSGAVAVELTDLDTPLTGRQTRTILTAGEGVTVDESVTLTQSLVAGFELLESANDRVRIGFEVDFGSDAATAKLNRNQVNVTGHLQDLYNAGLIDTDLASTLISLDDAKDYARIVNNMSAEVVLDNQITAIQSFRAFQQQLFSCADTTGSGAVRFLDDGQCVFATARGAGFERDSTSDNLGFSGSSWSVSGGGQVALGDDWTIGGALGYEWTQLDVSGPSASSDGHSVFGGGSIKRHFGALEIGASSSVGYASYDIDRQPFPGVPVEAEQNVWSLGGRVRAAYVFGSEKAFIKPRVDLGVDHFFGSSFSESGATGTRLSIDTDDETYVSLAPAVELGTELMAINGWRFRPNVTLGLIQYLNSPSPSLTAQFADAGDAVDGFDANTDFATTFVDLSGGVDVFAGDHAVLRADAFTSLSRVDTIYGGSLRLELPF